MSRRKAASAGTEKATSAAVETAPAAVAVANRRRSSGGSCHDGGQIQATGRNIALVGCPNAGKSSVFNHLTGMHAKIANYPGVTVSMTVGRIGRGPDNIAVVDLPGTYGLTPISPDEQVVADHLAGRLPGVEAPDALVVVVDATTLRRSLSLVAEALATGLPCVIALTMMDELVAGGGQIDVEALRTALGVEVFEVAGHRGRGVPQLREAMFDWATWPVAVIAPPVSDPEQTEGWIASVAEACRYRPAKPAGASRAIDRVLLHPVLGALIFLGVMFVFFQAIFTAVTPAADLIESVFGWLAGLARDAIGPPLLADFVATALIGGVGGVLVFLPQIALLFLLISVLEGSGYLARAALLMDRIMVLTGLDGRAFVSLLSSVACAIPGILSTRTLPSSRDRLATMMAAPLMTCSARLPVYLLLVSMLVPERGHWGPVSARGAVMFLLYLAGGLSALIAAAVFKTGVLRRGSVPFFLELPPYRVPSPRTVAVAVWTAVAAFLRKVSTVILVVTAVLWALMTFPTRQAETRDMDERAAAAYVLDHSYAASIGKTIEPVFAPLGFDWRINVGLVGAMAAREVFVTTLGQVAAAQDPENPAQTLGELRYTDGPKTGQRVFSTPTIVALLIYFVYAMQCMSTLAVIRRESNSLRWPLVAFGYLTVVAWIMAFAGHAVAGWYT